MIFTKLLHLKYQKMSISNDMIVLLFPAILFYVLVLLIDICIAFVLFPYLLFKGFSDD